MQAYQERFCILTIAAISVICGGCDADKSSTDNTDTNMDTSQDGGDDSDRGDTGTETGGSDSESSVDPGSTDSESEDTDAEPVPGETGSPCLGEEDCTPPLSCIDDKCQPDNCESGTLGCACDTGKTCVSDSAGNALACRVGVCLYPNCEAAGQTGCPCRNGETCETQGDACEDGICFSTECSAGEENCMCLAGGCDEGLLCKDNSICIDSTGYEGGACLEDESCFQNARCEADLNVCVYCDLGSQGCQCTTTGGCASGLECSDNICIDEDLMPPSEPMCYTPCESDLVIEDTAVQCDVDGLLEGCIGDKACIQGSCLNEGEEKPSCTSDLDCPFFQACLNGGCYSNCTSNEDCSTDLGCYKKVCRKPCQSSVEGACPSGYACEAVDGENGYCVAMQPASGAADTLPENGIKVSVHQLEFSNVKDSTDFQISSNSIQRESFTIRKVSHTIYYADGTSEKVEAKKDPVTGEYLECDAAEGECPLYWLNMGVSGTDASQNPTLEVEVLPSCQEADCPTVTVGNAGEMTGIRWEGELLITGNGVSETLLMSYMQRPEGRWGGKMYYFGNFSDDGLDVFRKWISDSNQDLVTLKNGLLQVWAGFMKNQLPGGWDEFKAVLTSTQTGSWNFASTKKKCAADEACYPYSNTSGVRTYVTDPETNLIPTGMNEFPMGMNFRIPEDGAVLEGRIESSIAMHYAANPAVSLEFKGDPSDATSCDPKITSDCVIRIKSFGATSVVGGRYHLSSGEECSDGYDKKQTPWLVPGFVQSAVEDESTGRYYQYSCRDNRLPYDISIDGSLKAANISLADGNPVPDGAPRLRTLKLLDGALINQTYLFILFEESFDSFVSKNDEDGGKGVSSYGYMILKKEPATIDTIDDDQDGIADSYEGNTPPSIERESAHLGVTCDETMLEELGIAFTPEDAKRTVNVLISGVDSSLDPEALPIERIHYYCQDTGLFDGGGNLQTPIECPAGSAVEFFVVPEPDFNTDTEAADPDAGDNMETDTEPQISAESIAAENCQKTVKFENGAYRGGTCRQVLNQWKENGIVESWEPYWKCIDETSSALCDENRKDLREGKEFYNPNDLGTGDKVFLPINSAIADAFRYKTQFQSRTGAQVGFAPQVCVPNSDQIPYCYDPEAIEEIRNREDCLIALYSNADIYGELSRLEIEEGDGTKKMLDKYLRESFSKSTAQDGFERLYAELLIMMGDESLTSAFASRFDLAGSNGAAFEGSLFENDGIDLSGVAGYEMYKLYEAVQYYQTVLDRLYFAGPNMSDALNKNDSTTSPTNFISPETVVLYLDRVIRASTQKTRAISEIAKNYQSFNRPDLARKVIERAYASVYMESVILTKLMYDVLNITQNSYKPQMRKTIEDGQLRYDMALLDMKTVYGDISDDATYFGLAPEYVPFPALNTTTMTDTNAFEVLMDTAKSKMETARQREDEALASNRSYNTDAASFQAELVRIQNNYEAQLGEICGTFEGADGQVHSAIRKYAALDDYATLLGDPCGLMRNGRIYNALVGYEDSLVVQDAIKTKLDNIYEAVLIETDRVEKVCGIEKGRAQYIFDRTGEKFEMVAAMTKEKQIWEAIGRVVTAGVELAGGLMCIPDAPSPPFDNDGGIAQCATQIADANIKFAGAMAQNIATIAQEKRQLENDKKLMNFDRDTAKFDSAFQCQAETANSNALVATKLLELKELRFEQIRAAHQSQLALADVDHLFREGKRLQDEQAENEQLSIDIEAAKNDPNIRIYRNDAIINADIAFNDAMQAAYRVTKVFEYYTSQSYAPKEKLFLIRMVGAGDYNLENYIMELQNAYFDFEEQFGNPDIRLSILSLRDNIMQIPMVDENGAALSQGARIDMMRAKLGNVELLDKNGYLSIPFSTTLDKLSPLTRNHKLAYVEADIVGADVGDTIGRVYLRQAGTGVVQDVSDEKDYYIFPERTAVINPFFNGNRLFTPDIYRNYRFRDRPLVNTLWELVINQRDEDVNKDINMQSISDIRVFLYYTDFTVF